MQLLRIGQMEPQALLFLWGLGMLMTVSVVQGLGF